MGFSPIFGNIQLNLCESREGARQVPLGQTASQMLWITAWGPKMWIDAVNKYTAVARFFFIFFRTCNGSTAAKFTYSPHDLTQIWGSVAKRSPFIARRLMQSLLSLGTETESWLGIAKRHTKIECLISSQPWWVSSAPNPWFIQAHTHTHTHTLNLPVEAVSHFMHLLCQISKPDLCAVHVSTPNVKSTQCKHQIHSVRWIIVVREVWRQVLDQTSSISL